MDLKTREAFNLGNVTRTQWSKGVRGGRPEGLYPTPSEARVDVPKVK